ncbi:MAG TPA: hypothetical protein VGQ17_05505 [Gemmatimonadales bacterium]|jgi:hypothetical protein|nr:hypothetical protein [Gemmatimonadales bacterium]
MQGTLIVAHRTDGTIEKGTSLDVDIKHPACHLRSEAGEVIEIPLADVKAIFFVKSFTGESTRHESKEPRAGDSRLMGARRVRVLFEDGEEVVGLMNRFPPITPFFFMLPIDPESNNIRILINGAAVKAMVEVTA